MITYQWDHDDLAYVQKKLGAMRAEAPRALRDAVNNTAKTARKLLLQEAQKRYTVKASGFNSRVNITKATLASQTAWIKVKGRTLTTPRYRYTAPRTGAAKAEVLAGSGLKPIIGANGIKAFVAKVTSGKSKTTQIMQRKGADRLPVRVMRSPSVPKQIEMVYDGRAITSTPLKKEIEKIYQANVQKQIQRFLNQ